MNGGGEHFRIAGAVVRVDWRDKAVRTALRGPLAVKAVAPATPDLVINAGRGLSIVDPSAGSGLAVTEDASGLTVADVARGIVHRLAAGQNVAGFECPDGAALPGSERAAPFRLILQHWLRPRRVHLLHAGAVGLPGRGAVLLAAPGGGGKSNTVLACLDSPLQLLGEDFVAVEDTAAPGVCSLYSTAKLLPADLARYPGLAADIVIPSEENDGKAVVDLARRHGGRLADTLPLRAILVLRITGAATTRLVPAGPVEAVKAMLTSLLMVLPSARRPLFEFTARLAARLPVYRLELGTDPRQIAAVVHGFLRDGSP